MTVQSSHQKSQTLQSVAVKSTKPSANSVDVGAHERNPGMSLCEEWLRNIHCNQSAIERRVATLVTRRSVKKQWQTAWLLKAITCLDLTSLSADDTPGRIRRLCAKARNPVDTELLAGLEAQSLPIQVGAVCVFHPLVADAVKALKGSHIPVAAVSTAFPSGMAPFETRLAEIKASVSAGAKEIDIVISRHLVLTENWEALYREVKAFREACGDAHLKAIIATGQLATLSNIAKASMVCMMAGADFIKTSTGTESKNATLAGSLVMVRMIREYYDATGHWVGFKPAGGISTAKDALHYLILIKEELGNDWLTPERFRLGASSLLTDIERQLEHAMTGRYSAYYRHSMA